MAVTYLDPTAEEGVPVEPYELFVDPKGGITIGLVNNTFPDSARFMDKLEGALRDLLPRAAIRRYQKPGLAPVADDQLAAIRDECDAVIAGWGH